MKKILLIIIIIALIVGGYEFYKSRADKKVEKQVTVEKEENINKSAEQKNNTMRRREVVQAKEFTLKNLQGEEVSLSQFKGKKVFLNFWATWCPYCRKEMPDIEKLYNKYKGTDIEILTIDIGESKNAVDKFMKTNNYTVPVLLDTDSKISAEYGARSTPAFALIDKEGNLVNFRKGAMGYEQMEEFINSN
ncbi:TlpA disulfide reductase family protein [uncultured Clostridium sp.]|uniref:TlpA family protein disulfide reductase n=1 Tax=uncultured Clostridium sp. TaxID=59620 RepID=UPI0026159E2B|nr:TlpA disulfide reductase family protein [uncultured Clostridium sp.]